MPALILSLVLCCATLAYGQYHRWQTTGGIITGQVVIKGVGPMLGGSFFLIDAEAGPPPAATKYWVVPSHVYLIDEDAKFKAEVPEGTYYVGAIERRSPEVLGPPEEGDYFFISHDEKGNPKTLTVWKHSRIDLGILDDATQFHRSMLEKKDITAIEGVIRDGQGKPVGGMAVFAYPEPVIFGHPLFVSERSDKDGKFSLRLYGGGYVLSDCPDRGWRRCPRSRRDDRRLSLRFPCDHRYERGEEGDRYSGEALSSVVWRRLGTSRTVVRNLRMLRRLC